MLDPALIQYQIRDALLYWLLIPAAVILSVKAVDFLLALPPLPRSDYLVIAAVFLLVGGLVLIWRSMDDFAKAGGTPNPLRPPKRLVTEGSYAICRHPMFLGYDLCALAVVLLLRSTGTLCISFPVFILLQIRFLLREERILLLKFKQSFSRYKKTTSFLLPMSLLRNIFRGQKW